MFGALAAYRDKRCPGHPERLDDFGHGHVAEEQAHLAVALLAHKGIASQLRLYRLVSVLLCVSLGNTWWHLHTPGYDTSRRYERQASNLRDIMRACALHSTATSGTGHEQAPGSTSGTWWRGSGIGGRGSGTLI